ncbi:hypothetical protein EDB85DRAFT_363811 [Lactarius pseudohatsudake]|nr:hypothetical protein EDB85DRAFT_363811 [Lactarius pseudohatsudake]
MTHTTDIPANKEVHFLHSDDPRDGFHVMGTDPLVFYSVMTPVGFLTTHTIVNDASGTTVATLNWTGSSALGTCDQAGVHPEGGLTWATSSRLSHPRQTPARFFVKAPTASCAPFGGVVTPPTASYDVRHDFLRPSDQHYQGPFCIDDLPMGCCSFTSANEPDVCVGLFRMHRPPEQLSVGDNYATLYFVFLDEPLLLHALLALCLNRWLDREVACLE